MNRSAILLLALASLVLTAFSVVPLIRWKQGANSSAVAQLQRLEKSQQRLQEVVAAASPLQVAEHAENLTRAFGIVAGDGGRPTPTADPRRARATRRRIPSLTGILCSSNSAGIARRTALLNGRSVGPGDEVNGYRVERIEADGVTLSNRQSTWFLEAPEVDYSAWRSNE